MDKKNFKRKLKLNKQTVAKLTNLQNVTAGNFDTPTFRDRCDHKSFLICKDRTEQNTYCVCKPGDWCGYHHETNCAGPAITGVGPPKKSGGCVRKRG